ncbi:MAG TPA: glycogen/starch synthase [Polyangiales bacterium]|nr:glycogen/starch synthase [Polyangiales bacterium]
MEILFVTTELAPYSVDPRAPEIAEAAASLPKALRGLGHRVVVISPLYKGIDPTARSLARRLSAVNVEVLGKSYTCHLYDGRTTGGVDLIFLANPELFGDHSADGIGAIDADTRLRSSLLLSAAAAQIAHTREPKVDVLHARGAATAAALPLAKQLRPELGCALSIHDGDDPLLLPLAQLSELFLPEALRNSVLQSSPSLLSAGIKSADAVVVNSTASARRMVDPEYGPLAALLQQKGPRFLGIVNGVDASIWNPLVDSHLSSRFDATDLSGKQRCKGALQYMLGLGVHPDTPLVVAIGELSEARGGDLIAQVTSDCMRSELQLCVLGSEGPAAEQVCSLSSELPERLAIRTSHDEKERHLALGAADFLLLPAREPRSVEIALSAMRYGALPIVHNVGPLGDHIVDVDAKLETGNGFLIEAPTAEEVLASVQRAVNAYARQKPFDALRKRAMRHDVSWERSARRYEHLFKQIAQVAAPAA